MTGNQPATTGTSDLELRLRESEETLDAIRRGDVDALVVEARSDMRVYTLQHADQPYRVLIEQIQEGTVTVTMDGAILFANRRMAGMLELTPEQTAGQWLQSFIPEAEHPALANLLRAAKDGRATGELTICGRNGAVLPVSASFGLLTEADPETLICGVLSDLSRQHQHMRDLSAANARLQAEIFQREAAEEALRQSQKMEAVGQLTGGLSHDFNNLLTGIIGALEMIQQRLAQGRYDVERYISAAQGAAQRAASLTHRLLAFSRRQTLDPRPTDINRLVFGLADLVRRTVGPEIAVSIAPADDLWPALIDSGQLENALLNLCINGRDAMPQGGDLRIVTENRIFDPAEAKAYDIQAGDYVRVAVTDTGCGMPPDIAKRAFDPFFTTKPIGVGTGLGLSMVYGFVRQSGGQVRIETEVGAGTTIKLYFPRHYGKLEESEPYDAGPKASAPAGAGQSVLVVDDEPTVRMFIGEVLGQLGYAALEAANGAAALTMLRSNARIDLLITDVGLPGGVNGRQLADNARTLRPGLKILFVTGYAETAVLDPDAPDANTLVLTKPFAIDAFTAKIRTLLTPKA